MFSAQVTKAPDFCAASYIHNFRVEDEEGAGDGRQAIIDRWERKTRAQKAVMALAFAKRYMDSAPHRNRSRYYLCDRVDEGMDKFICEYLPKTFECMGHRYEVVRGRPFMNYNTGNMVRQTVMRRLA
jgi:hypothetical protein